MPKPMFARIEKSDEWTKYEEGTDPHAVIYDDRTIHNKLDGWFDDKLSERRYAMLMEKFYPEEV